MKTFSFFNFRQDIFCSVNKGLKESSVERDEGCGVVLTDDGMRRGRQDLTLPELRLIAELDHRLVNGLRRDLPQSKIKSRT